MAVFFLSVYEKKIYKRLVVMEHSRMETAQCAVLIFPCGRPFIQRCWESPFFQTSATKDLDVKCKGNRPRTAENGENRSTRKAFENICSWINSKSRSSNFNTFVLKHLIHVIWYNWSFSFNPTDTKSFRRRYCVQHKLYLADSKTKYMPVCEMSDW